jgi:DNA-binding response OmpR family regulator
MDHAPRVDRTALVVEDDVFVLAALAELLEEDGFDVHTASNGFSAVRAAIELRPSVMLLDLALPERSGKEVLDDLRAEPSTHDMAIVVVTGHPDMLTETELAQTDGFVIKPFDGHELLGIVHHAVQRAANRRAEVAPVVARDHRDPAVRGRRASGARRTRGRR